MAVIIGSWSWYVCEVHQPNCKDLGNGRFFDARVFELRSTVALNRAKTLINDGFVPEVGIRWCLGRPRKEPWVARWGGEAHWEVSGNLDRALERISRGFGSSL